jgi:hypothetical protein
MGALNAKALCAPKKARKLEKEPDVVRTNTLTLNHWRGTFSTLLCNPDEAPPIYCNPKEFDEPAIVKIVSFKNATITYSAHMIRSCNHYTSNRPYHQYSGRAGRIRDDNILIALTHAGYLPDKPNYSDLNPDDIMHRCCYRIIPHLYDVSENIMIIVSHELSLCVSYFIKANITHPLCKEAALQTLRDLHGTELPKTLLWWEQCKEDIIPLPILSN